MKALLCLFFSLIALGLQAQPLNPVRWEYRVEKISDRSYALHITATIQNGWHLFSQIQPENALAMPTSIQFSKNTAIVFIGKTKETGQMEKYTEASLGVEQWQYADKVSFVQAIQLKNKSAAEKVKVTGTIEFQTCSDEKCLPPKTIDFEVAL